MVGTREHLVTTWSSTRARCFGTHALDSGFQKDSYYANMVFIGAHFQKAEDIKFKSLSINYSHLDEWADISGFDIQNSPKDRETTIKYKQTSQARAYAIKYSTVGGVVTPVNKLEILTLYLAPAGLIAAVLIVYVTKRRKD